MIFYLMCSASYGKVAEILKNIQSCQLFDFGYLSGYLDPTTLKSLAIQLN